MDNSPALILLLDISKFLIMKSLLTSAENLKPNHEPERLTSQRDQ